MSDSDSSYVAEKNWECNNPTKYEIRFNDDSDIISSDSTDTEFNRPNKAKKYNQLLPIGKKIYKLLRSAKPDCNRSWTVLSDRQNVLRENIENGARFDDQSDNLSSDNSEAEESYSENTKNIRQLESRYKGNDSVQKAVGNKVGSKKYSDSDLDTVSFRSMAKRKREESLDEDKVGNIKRVKIASEKSTSKKIKLKGNSPDVSFSEDDELDTDFRPIKIKSKGLGDVNKTNRNPLNTHLLSSESDNAADQSCDDSSIVINTEETNKTLNGEISDSENESAKGFGDVNHVNNSDATPSVRTESTKKLHRITTFTHELREEISKFSLLLDGNLTENNDIWVLQCPSNMDCSALISQRLSLGGSGLLEDGERTFETYSYRNPNPRSTTLAVPTDHNSLNLRRIPITGNIIVEESIKADKRTSSDNIISEPPSRVEFPENLRTRHPLLGIGSVKQWWEGWLNTAAPWPEHLCRPNNLGTQENHSNGCRRRPSRRPARSHDCSQRPAHQQSPSYTTHSGFNYSLNKEKLFKSRDKLLCCDSCTIQEASESVSMETKIY